jgi:BirA family transcriptional regulator, biotin operon repressor / biotin---[acetyl-CoA-carboxylase] ligase
MTTPWPAESIWSDLEPVLSHFGPGFTVEVLPEVDSTNSELMRRARAGRLEPTLLVAQSQTAGRGRLGRGWASQPGSSLTCSLGLPYNPPSWAGLSLAVGVAVAESLHASIRLKWPNDLWLPSGSQDRKLGGILVETAAPLAGKGLGAERYVIIGLGLNIEPLPEHLAQAATASPALPPAALRELLPSMTAAHALQALALPLAQALQQFEAQGFAAFAPRFAARDALRGRAVYLSDHRHGVCRGVNDEGALLVHTGQGLEAITSADLSVRPS